MAETEMGERPHLTSEKSWVDSWQIGNPRRLKFRGIDTGVLVCGSGISAFGGLEIETNSFGGNIP